MSENLSPTAERRAPRVVVIGLASCFGCQINITNIEHVHEVALDVRDVDLAAEAAGQADNDHAGSTALGGR